MKSGDDRLIYLIFTAQHRLREYLKSALMAKGIKITPVQSGILFLLQEKDGQPMSELSQILSTDNSTITGLVDRLEKAGFALRKRNPKDRRSSLIRITGKGTKEANKAKVVINRVNDEIIEVFAKKDIETFKKILLSLSEGFKKV